MNAGTTPFLIVVQVTVRAAGVVRLEVLPEAHGGFCFLRRLHRFVYLCTYAGIPLQPFLLRPQKDNRQGFKESCLSSSELNKRFQKVLADHGLWDGETLHGVRRGSLQQDATGGASIEAIGRHALHAPPYTTTEQYLDTSREVGGGARLHNFRKRALSS